MFCLILYISVKKTGTISHLKIVTPIQTRMTLAFIGRG